MVVYIGASGVTKGKMAYKISRFLGDISYPLYIIHYPFIYMYMAWIAKNQEFIDTAPLGKTTMILISITVLLVTVALAYALFKLYDVPVRKWLTNKLMKK